MTARPAFLTTRYGGYFHREVPEEDAELSHVGPDTPCGEYVRRFWQPIFFSDELKDLPHRVKILGEELVVFCDRSGTVALLELHCSASRRVAGVRADRRQWHKMLLPWLAVRGGRDDPRDARRTGSQHPKRPALSRGLSHP